jgi:succinoglycan biosynthesis protein ExoO
MSVVTKVSVLMACLNPGTYLPAAVESCLSQRNVDVELIVIDDGSTDGSLDWLIAKAQSDHRLKLFRGRGRGPAAARNLGLEQSTGDWVAIVDADDVIHLDRFRILIELAEKNGAEISADQLLAFQDSASGRRCWPFLSESLSVNGTMISLGSLLTPSDGAFGSEYGYLKPLINRAFLTAHKLQYDESVIVGEDFDFLARLVATGGRLYVTGIAMYFYRRHQGSLSYRLSALAASGLISANRRFRETYLPVGSELLDAVDKRDVALRRYKNAVNVMEALKLKRIGGAVLALFSAPSPVSIVAQFAMEAVEKRLRRGRKNVSARALETELYIPINRLAELKPTMLDAESVNQIVVPLAQSDQGGRLQLKRGLEGTFWDSYIF